MKWAITVILFLFSVNSLASSFRAEVIFPDNEIKTYLLEEDKIIDIVFDKVKTRCGVGLKSEVKTLSESQTKFYVIMLTCFEKNKTLKNSGSQKYLSYNSTISCTDKNPSYSEFFITDFSTQKHDQHRFKLYCNVN